MRDKVEGDALNQGTESAGLRSWYAPTLRRWPVNPLILTIKLVPGTPEIWSKSPKYVKRRGVHPRVRPATKV